MDRPSNARAMEHPIEEILFDLLALGALSGEERADLEAHVAACPECALRAREAQGRIAMLAFAAPPQQPPASIKQELMRKIQSAASSQAPAQPAPAPSVEALPAKPAAPRRAVRFRPVWWIPAFAVVVVVLAVAVVLLLNTNQRLSQHIRALNSQIAALQTDAHNMRIAMHREITIAEVVTAQDTIAVNLAPQPGQQRGTARVLYRPRTGFVVYTGSLAPVPPSKSYQLWLVPAAGNPISAGVLQSPSGTFIAHVPAGTLAKAFAITLEPHGGMPQPTGAKVVVGAVAST